MKLVSFKSRATTGYGALVNGEVAVLSAQLPFPTLKTALPHLDELRRAVDSAPTRLALSQLELLPPIPDPGRIMCVGRNFKKAMHQMGLDFLEYPVLFARFPHSVVGHGEEIVRPTVSEQFDYEGELAVVIGRAGRHIRAEDALDHVAGYCCFNDGSIRDYQRHTSQDTPGKNFWRSGAAGPWLTTADEIADPTRLTLTTRVNEKIVQQATLDDLLFDVPHVISYLSGIYPLQPGDMIAMGTPLGVGLNADPPRWLKPGDTVSVEIDGIGTLSNRVVDEAGLDLAAA
ncbi:fumarylacetoacetate hydrolase family protein [Sphingomonas sp. LaA6.9]|uniref:fumarylacetoacetate hydrolase family protein n=1 Tax=Sphingomonas sp. LaA6.9 TaxID=2919914 RepID=UPI001F4FE4E3|nr:fumarylacetoacetate hydrolase family protein [Sphingomonas sp. LaA6.9]MCJ8159013.1 fumarylacetoacetate hydrolase family protein [Sphingomonas sp. LaA6.9]